MEIATNELGIYTILKKGEFHRVAVPRTIHEVGRSLFLNELARISRPLLPTRAFSSKLKSSQQRS